MTGHSVPKSRAPMQTVHKPSYKMSKLETRKSSIVPQYNNTTTKAPKNMFLYVYTCIMHLYLKSIYFPIF